MTLLEELKSGKASVRTVLLLSLPFLVLWLGVAWWVIERDRKPVEVAVSDPPNMCREVNNCDRPVCAERLRDCLNPPKFRIPKAYLYVNSNHQGGIQRDIYLAADLPGMQASVNRTRSDASVRIKLHTSGAESIRQKFDRFSNISRPTRQPVDFEGMEHYRSVKPGIFSDDFYIRSGDQADSFFVCADRWKKADGTEASVGCTAYTRYHGLDLEYSFLRARFGERAEIRAKVVALLDSFLMAK